MDEAPTKILLQENPQKKQSVALPPLRFDLKIGK
jgi:hypothetical protein